MKRFLKVVSLFLAVVLLSGCVKYNIDMKITSDKKMNMTFITAVSTSMSEGEGVTTSTDEELVTKMKNEGWKVEDYKDEEFTGNKLTKEFADIDKLSSDNSVVVDLNEFGEDGKTPEYFFQKKDNTYIAKFAFKIDSTSGENEVEPAEGVEVEEKQDAESQKAMEEMTKQMMKTMDLKFTVEVPNVVSSNATTTDGNKLTWDLTKMEEGKNVEFTFTLGDKVIAEANSYPIVPIIIGGGSILLLLVVLVVFITTRKKKASAPVAEMTSMPSVSSELPSMPSVEPVAPVEAPVVPSVEPTSPVYTPLVSVPETPVPSVEPVAPVEAPVVPSVEPTSPVDTPLVSVPETPAPSVEVPTPVQEQNNSLDNNNLQ